MIFRHCGRLAAACRLPLLSLLCVMAFSSCQKRVCPAYQSAFIMGQEYQDDFFSYFTTADDSTGELVPKDASIFAGREKRRNGTAKRKRDILGRISKKRRDNIHAIVPRKVMIYHLDSATMDSLSAGLKGDSLRTFLRRHHLDDTTLYPGHEQTVYNHYFGDFLTADFDTTGDAAEEAAADTAGVELDTTKYKWFEVWKWVPKFFKNLTSSIGKGKEEAEAPEGEAPADGEAETESESPDPPAEGEDAPKKKKKKAKKKKPKKKKKKDKSEDDPPDDSPPDGDG